MSGKNSTHHDIRELKKLVSGIKTNLELREKINDALKNNPYFKNRPKCNVAAVMRALRDRDLLAGIKKDHQVVINWTEEKKEEFKKVFSDSKYVLSVEEIREKFNLDNNNQVYNVAHTLDLKRPVRTLEDSCKFKAADKTVNKRLVELIFVGILLMARGWDELYKKIAEEFPGNNIARGKSFKARAVRCLWCVREIDKALQDVVRAQLNPLKEFKRVYPFIPDDIIEARAKWHSGKISGYSRKLMGKNLPGIGRIDLSGAMPNFKMPETSFSNPLKIEVADPENWSVSYLNGANLGIKHGSDIVGNVARKIFSDAQERKDEAVILTNILCLDLKKAGGPAKTARAQVFGDNVNPDLIQDKEYRGIVKRILQELPMDEVIYRTPEELLNDILGGWIKVCTKPNHHPEYTGPVFVVLGMNEKALIEAVTYWEIRWWTKQKQDELDAQIKWAAKALKEAEKKLEAAEEGEDEELVDKLYAQVQEKNEKLLSKKHQRARTTVSEVATQDSQRFFAHACSVLIQKIEEAIPNAKVIGFGTNHVRIGGKIGEIFIPSHLRVTDSLLSDYALSYGPKVLREQMADFTVICHPWSLQTRMTVREIDHDGKRDSMKVYVAPIGVDDVYLRSQISASYAKDHPVIKAVYNETFRAGVLRLRCTDGIIDADDIPAGALESFKNYPKLRVKRAEITGAHVYRRGPRNIWLMCCSDQHWGGRAKEFLFDKQCDMHVSLAEAVFSMMRRDGLCEGNNMPVHILLSPDDPTQGQNHKYRTEQDPHHMPVQLIEKMINKWFIEARDSATKKEVLVWTEKMRNLIMHQLEKRGVDYLLEQMMQMIDRHIISNVDIFSSILRRAKNTDIVIKGVGEIVLSEYGGFDTRNIGIINIGSGDRHFAKTLDYELAEGPLYAKILRSLLLGLDEWRDKKNFIENMVVSPMYGQTCLGWGVVSVGGKHEYGLEMRAAPYGSTNWGDTLRNHVKKDISRGNYARIWNKKLPIIKIFGDKHFFGGISTPYAIYHMSPAAVHTDGYGETGFPPNNSGVSFLGVPVDGPESGPILWRMLPFEVIKYYMEDEPGKSLNWEEFLPNPA